jgi:hypothetical protein
VLSSLLCPACLPRQVRWRVAPAQEFHSRYDKLAFLGRYSSAKSRIASGDPEFLTDEAAVLSDVRRLIADSCAVSDIRPDIAVSDCGRLVVWEAPTLFGQTAAVGEARAAARCHSPRRDVGVIRLGSATCGPWTSIEWVTKAVIGP